MAEITPEVAKIMNDYIALLAGVTMPTCKEILLLEYVDISKYPNISNDCLALFYICELLNIRNNDSEKCNYATILYNLSLLAKAKDCSFIPTNIVTTGARVSFGSVTYGN